MTIAYFVAWMMVFMRTLGVILQLPIMTERPLPIMVRVGLCVCIATLLAGIVPAAPVPFGLWDLVKAIGGEVMLGLALGFVGRMVFAAVEMAGRIMTTEIGLSATPGMGVPEPSSEPVAALLNTFAVVLFFMFGGHLMMLSALARSFVLAPAGHPALSPDAGETMIAATSQMLELGLRLAAPFIAMNFLVTVAFSVLGRVVPKMNVFVMSFSVRVVAGLTLLSSAGALVARYLDTEFGDTALRMLHLLPVGK
jgi:flagellar biosynthesis protein FliR